MNKPINYESVSTGDFTPVTPSRCTSRNCSRATSARRRSGRTPARSTWSARTTRASAPGTSKPSLPALSTPTAFRRYGETEPSLRTSSPERRSAAFSAGSKRNTTGNEKHAACCAGSVTTARQTEQRSRLINCLTRALRLCRQGLRRSRSILMRFRSDDHPDRHPGA